MTGAFLLGSSTLYASTWRFGCHCRDDTRVPVVIDVTWEPTADCATSIPPSPDALARYLPSWE